MKLDDLVRGLEKIYEEKLLSIILYGSQVEKDTADRLSDYNLIVVLKDLAAVEIAKSNPIIKKWVKKGNPLPLFFDPYFIESSADVFPMEFTDVKLRHKILLGTDPFTNINIDQKNLRHQCESELKGKLMHLRSQYALISNNPKAVQKLILSSISTFVVIFRGLLSLLGKTPPSSKKGVIETLKQFIDFDPEVFFETIGGREGEDVVRSKDAGDLFERYLAELRTIASFIDQYQT